MSSIVTSILSSTVGLLLNKARDMTAAKLKDGDITDRKLREIVVRDLNDVKTKLDCLSRKDLLSSYQFLKEGVDLLNVSLTKSNLDEQKALFNQAPDSSGEISSNGAESSILNQALKLPHSMKTLEINSDEEFRDSSKRFKDARRAATHAFCNESLSIKDRIFAAKLRVVSEILEYLSRPETAIVGCLSFLQELHSLPAVCEMFTVYLKGGAKAMFNKAERVENVKSVMLINYVLFQYCSTFRNKCYLVLDWPVIELAERRLNPVANWQEVSTRRSMNGGLMIQPPNEITFDKDMKLYDCAINSHGDILMAYDDHLKVISSAGECRVVKLSELRESEDQVARAITVNYSNNNVYIVKRCKTRTESGDVFSYVLCVLDDNYNEKHSSNLTFLKPSRSASVLIAITANQNDDIVMVIYEDPHVYIFDDVGRLKHKFEADSYGATLSVSDKNEIMVKSNGRKVVNIYTREGTLRLRIRVRRDHLIWGVVFHPVISKIIILTSKYRSFFLLYYSTCGDLVTTMFVCGRNESLPFITSHPIGPVAIIRDKSITYI